MSVKLDQRSKEKTALKTEGLIYKTIFVLNIFCIVAGTAVSIKNIFNPASGILMRAGGILTIIAFLVAAIYVFKGYTKTAAICFKLFTAAFAFSLILSIIGAAQISIIPAIFEGLSLVLVVVIALKKDFGKSNSFSVCGIIAILAIANIIEVIKLNPGVKLSGNNYESLVLGRSIAQFLLSYLFGIITYAKYLDKESRGTK